MPIAVDDGVFRLDTNATSASLRTALIGSTTYLVRRSIPEHESNQRNGANR
jgi:hypothetical protein